MKPQIVVILHMIIVKKISYLNPQCKFDNSWKEKIFLFCSAYLCEWKKNTYHVGIIIYLVEKNALYIEERSSNTQFLTYLF